MVLATIVIVLSAALYLFISPGGEKISTSVATQTPKETGAQTLALTEPKLSEYLETLGGCGPYFEGTCVNMRSGPGKEYPVAGKLRNGMILETSGVTKLNGREWYKITFDDWLWYPERVTGDYFVAAEFVQSLLDEGNISLENGTYASSTKRILVDRSEQMLYAYEGKTLFMKEPISTGLEFTPTPRGIFTIYKKTPSRYMQGPLPGVSDQYYDLPGVPWNLYFTEQGGVIHGAYWHDKFGQPWSHGCVNLPPEQAKKLYRWANVGTQVVVRD
jgi:hypothetical protein